MLLRDNIGGLIVGQMLSQGIAAFVAGAGMILILGAAYWVRTVIRGVDDSEPAFPPKAAAAPREQPRMSNTASILLTRYRGFELRTDPDNLAYHAGGATFASLEEAKAFVDVRLK